MLSGVAVKLTSHKPGLSTLASSLVTAVTIRDKDLTLSSEPNVTIGTFDAFIAKILGTLSSQDGLQLQSYIGQQSRFHLRAPKDYHPTLSVIIYGPPDSSELVGTWLLQCDLHLQDPEHCDRNVVYVNPQSLVQNPRMTQEQCMEVSQEIDDFAQASDLLADLESEESLAEAISPLAISTPLHSHQKQALTFMERREKGWAYVGSGKDIWRAALNDQGNVEYTNTISGETSCIQPPNFRGGIIADQMGLGKSLSIISLIAKDLETSIEDAGIRPFDSTTRTTLLVVRAALLQTWETQLRTHVVPGKVTWRLHHDKARVRDRSDLQSTHIVITTYHLLMSEWKKHQNSPNLMYTTNWHRVVLDEAHDIRDHRSMISKAICALEAHSRWALTGTPIQNRISDLASLFKFLRVYPYHEVAAFGEQVATLSRDPDQGIDKLKDMVRCIMLRRSIATIELPERRDVVSKLDFSAQELDAYNRVKDRTREALHDPSAQSSDSRTQLNVLSWMQKLLMICSLGAKADVLDVCKQDDIDASICSGDWNAVTAQQAFNRLVAVGGAVCEVCSADLVSVVTEVADQTPGKALHPVMFSCMFLICALCQERSPSNQPTCKHEVPCAYSAISTLSSSTHKNDIQAEGQDFPACNSDHDTPTKVKALLQDILVHYDREKRFVPAQ